MKGRNIRSMKLIKQFFKFGCVGIINTVNSWIIYYSLIFFNVNYLLATTIAYILSSIIGYLLNNIWVFNKNKKDSKKKKSILRYYIVYISSYILNMLCMYLLVNILQISNKIAPILVLFITVPYNFLFSKFWIFKSDIHMDRKKIEELAKKKHTFAICAYKESEYLEQCIKSIIGQTIKSNCIIATSTPSEYIEKLARKYNIEYFVKNGKSDIQDDWNFAAKQAKTELVTIAHQDDIYEEKYVEELISKYDENGIMYFTDYYPYKNNKKVTDENSKIKKILKVFLKSKILSKFKLFKKMSLSLGNTICCPSVTYNKNIIDGDIFTSNLKFGLDWDTFLKLANTKSRFVYIPHKLINYRIHDGATTKQFIQDHRRINEDIEMFNKFWPKCITKIIMKFYVKSYNTY